MPIGPSHGSRGGSGGGRSFGGGSRSSGGSSFSFGGGRRSSSSSHHHHHSSSGSSLGGAIIGGLIYSAFADRRRRRFHNRYGYDPTPDEINSMPRRKAPTIFLILSIIIAFISMGTMSLRSMALSNANSYKTTMTIMEDDYHNDYKPMIDRVKSYSSPTSTSTVDCGNGYYKAIASFKNTFDKISVYYTYGDNPSSNGAYLDIQEDGISYYFLVYSFVDHKGIPHTGLMTYTQFSASQYKALDGEIEIAYYYENDKFQYSMNTSYNIEESAEYDYYEDLYENNKESASTYLLTFIVEVLIAAGLLALFILKLRKYRKLIKQDDELLYQKKQAETQKAQAEAQEARIDAQRKNRFCQYCGSQIDENTNVCSGCGARASDN